MTTHDIHQRLHRTFIRNIRDEQARVRAEYNLLPWWRRLFKRRPKQEPWKGAYAVLDEHIDWYRDQWR